MNVQKQTLVRAAALVAYCVLLSMPVMAAGLETGASEGLIKVRSAIYTIIGIACTIALVWQFFQGLSNKKTWQDVGESCAWIFGAGAAITFATWVFKLGGEATIG